jgi:hypothetical protein
MGGPSGAHQFYEDEVFGKHEQELFTAVVAVAEQQGKHVNLLVVPSTDMFQGITQTAFRLEAAQVIAGPSSVLSPEAQRQRLEVAWKKIPGSLQRLLIFSVIDAQGQRQTFLLGAHSPHLFPEDVQLIHELWLSVVEQPGANDNPGEGQNRV